MQGTNHIGVQYMSPNFVEPSWQVIGTTDLTGTGHSDIVWRNNGGWMGFWFMSGTTRTYGVSWNPGWGGLSWGWGGCH
jgi:hypothetical protein